MLVKDLTEKYGFEISAGGSSLNNEIKKAYIGDLLSWVMGRAPEGSAWVTIQGHINVIAVAELINAACIIVCENASFTPDTISKADSEGIPLLKTKLTAYEVAKIFVAENV
ncbi:MAG: AraC family transcriptional regulator [Clostridiales bacterium]|nr:AraC family transcriptional regulator [Clostridiales bacterium]